VAADNPRWHPRDVDVKVDMLRQCGRDTVVRTIEDSVPFDVAPLLATLTVPTLVLGGDPAHDSYVTPEAGEAIAASHPVIDFAVVAGGSHSMHRDAYDGFWAAISRFLLDQAD
jgi:pimeloyl-ACP methyl ester carboxylesterase